MERDHENNLVLSPREVGAVMLPTDRLIYPPSLGAVIYSAASTALSEFEPYGKNTVGYRLALGIMTDLAAYAREGSLPKEVSKQVIEAEHNRIPVYRTDRYHGAYSHLPTLVERIDRLNQRASHRLLGRTTLAQERHTMRYHNQSTRHRRQP
jgi:hypothetical protein